MKASVFIGCSVDGFIARADGRLDFLPPGGGEPHGYEEFMASVDALIIGRNTFETVLSFPAWPYGDKPVLVLGVRLPLQRCSGTRYSKPSRLCGGYRCRGIQHAYVDGGLTIQRFLRAGLIHRLIITRVPVLKIGSWHPSLRRNSAGHSLEAR